MLLRHRRLFAALGGALVLSGCAKDAPQDTWKPAGENAQRIQDLQWPVFLVAGIVGVIVMAVVAFVVVFLVVVFWSPILANSSFDSFPSLSASSRSKSGAGPRNSSRLSLPFPSPPLALRYSSSSPTECRAASRG